MFDVIRILDTGMLKICSRCGSQRGVREWLLSHIFNGGSNSIQFLEGLYRGQQQCTCTAGPHICVKKKH